MNAPNNIAQARVKAGLTQVAASARAGLQPSFWNRIELHGFSVTPPIANRIAHALDADLDAVFPAMRTGRAGRAGTSINSVNGSVIL